MQLCSCVVGRLDVYRTKVLLYRTMVLLARPTKVRCQTCDRVKIHRFTIGSGRFADSPSHPTDSQNQYFVWIVRIQIPQIRFLYLGLDAGPSSPTQRASTNRRIQESCRLYAGLLVLMQDWEFLRRELILIIRFFHGKSVEGLSQDTLGWARSPSFQVQLTAHNFLFGSSFTTHFNYANTCSFNSTSSLPCLSTSFEVGNLAQITILEFESLLYSSQSYKLLQEFAVEEFFSYKLLNARKGKVKYRRATYKICR